MIEGVELVVLDWSGTLSDDRRPVHKANTLMCEHYGIPAITDINEWLAATNRGPQEFFMERGVRASFDEIWEVYKTCFNRVIASGINPVVYEGVPKVLEALKSRGKILAILSAHPETNLHQEAKGYGIFEYFDVIQGSVAKKSDAIIQISQSLGIPKAKSVYIGDMFSDVVAAKEAGVHPVAVTCGYHTKEMLSPHEPTGIWPSVSAAYHELP